jgi:hypothetical protein
LKFILPTFAGLKKVCLLFTLGDLCEMNMLAWLRTSKCAYQIVLRLSRDELLCNRFTVMLLSTYSFSREHNSKRREELVNKLSENNIMCWMLDVSKFVSLS